MITTASNIRTTVGALPALMLKGKNGDNMKGQVEKEVVLPAFHSLFEIKQ